MPAVEEGQLIAVGVIRKAVGLDGQCGVMPFGATLSRVAVPCSLYAGTDERSVRPMTLVRVKQVAAQMRCHFAGVADRTSAEALNGQVLFLAQQDLPPLPDGRFYHFQVEGLPVVLDGSDQQWGTVSAVHNYPTSDALEVRRPDGSTVLVPLTPDGGTRIDIAARMVLLDRTALEEIL